MAANFRILKHLNNDSLHLKLVGDFDGSAGYELANLLKKNWPGVERAFIHTAALRSVYPHGCRTFQNNLGLPKNELVGLFFTGDKAKALAPEGARIHGLRH